MTSTNDPVLNELFETIVSLYEADKSRPFPYDDCRKVIGLLGKEVRDLIPDFALYSATLAGYCSRGQRIHKMPLQEIAEAQKIINKSFFDRHPEYLAVQAIVSESKMPHLFQKLDLHEKMRNALSMIFDRMELQPNPQI